MDNDVATKQVAMSENQLKGSVIGRSKVLAR